MDHNCIICMYDDHYEIAGPFASRDELRAFGARWQKANDDRPTWQSIYLADPHAAPRVVTASTMQILRDAMAVNVRGNMKRVLRKHFPNATIAEIEGAAEQAADVARDYAIAIKDRGAPPFQNAT